MMEPFHAHHAPVGANASFVAGLDLAAAGFAGADGTPGDQGLFVGVRQAPELPWRMLPLFQPETPLAAGSTGRFEVLTPGRYGRTFALASDRWLIGPLVFKLCSPFWRTALPGSESRETERLHFAPSIGGFVEYDNTHSDEPVEVLVGIGGSNCDFRKLEGDACGFVSGGRFGFATVASPDARMRMGDSPFAEATESQGPTNSAALVFTVPAKVKRVFPLVLGVFDPNESTLFYRSRFDGVADVLASALANNAAVIRQAGEIDATWFGSKLTREQKVQLAHAVRSCLAHSAIREAAGVWNLERRNDGTTPVHPAVEGFEATHFPWAVAARMAAGQSWIDSWAG